MAISKDPSAGKKPSERPMSFVATPERVSAYVGLKEKEVATQLKSVQGRQDIFDKLIKNEGAIRKNHADFKPEELRSQLDAAGEALVAHERYLKDVSSPEKKGMFRRAWDAIKSFPRKHPVITALLVAALIAGGVAGGLYLAGYWETVVASVGLNKIMGMAKSIGELAPVTPETVPLPGGGMYDVPPPMPGPGGFPDIPH